MLLSALPRSHTLRWLCASDEIRLFGLTRRCNLPSGLSSCSRVDRVRLRSRLMLDPKRYLGLKPWHVATRPLFQRCRRCARITSSSSILATFLRIVSLSRLLPAPGAVGVAQRLVDLCAHPQTVQEHRELPRHGHRRPLLGVVGATGGYLLSVAS